VFTTSSKPALWSYWLSSASWRVRIALHYKGIPYDYHAINLVKKEQQKEKFATQSPMGRLPVLEIDGLKLVESSAILEYLEETRSKPPLLPSEAKARYHVRLLCSIIGSGIQPLQNIAVLEKLSEFAGDPSPSSNAPVAKKWAAIWIEKGLTAVEKIVKETSGKYSVGDQITFADCFLVPQVYHAQRMKVDLKPFPTIVRLCESLNTLPVFQRAHARAQPDTPEEIKSKL